MRLFERAIPRFGSANWCSTAFGERSHKDKMDMQVTCIPSAGVPHDVLAQRSDELGSLR